MSTAFEYVGSSLGTSADERELLFQVIVICVVRPHGVLLERLLFFRVHKVVVVHIVVVLLAISI